MFEHSLAAERVCASYMCLFKRLAVRRVCIKGYLRGCAYVGGRTMYEHSGDFENKLDIPMAEESIFPP